jgi:DNA-binding transcriptional regulator LsrR (DeoR family)
MRIYVAYLCIWHAVALTTLVDRLWRNMADPELLADIARKFYWSRKGQKEIGDSLTPKRKQPEVARLLSEARVKGVVAFDIDAKFALGGKERAQSSVRDLRSRFHLKDALVIDLQGNVSGDILHTALANHAGRRAVVKIEDGDHICVAGGRTIVQFARYIGRHSPSKKGIVISPLGGRLWTGSWQIGGPAHLEYPLDADDSAFFLYLAFLNEVGTRFSQISLPLFARSRREAKELIRNHCPARPDGTWNWGLKPANRGYVGVGTLDALSGHRIAEFLAEPRSKRRRDVPYLGRAAKELRDIMALAARSRLPAFGDIGNRLFAAVPRPSRVAADLRWLSSAYNQVARVLADVNERSITFRWRHLHSTPDVNVIAGGPLKADQLWTVLMLGVLHPDRKLCSELTTDGATADALAAFYSEYEQATSDVKSWYARILPRLFPGP